MLFQVYKLIALLIHFVHYQHYSIDDNNEGVDKNMDAEFLDDHTAHYAGKLSS